MTQAATRNTFMTKTCKKLKQRFISEQTVHRHFLKYTADCINEIHRLYLRKVHVNMLSTISNVLADVSRNCFDKGLRL